MIENFKKFLVHGYYSVYDPLSNTTSNSFGPYLEEVWGEDTKMAISEWERRVLPKETYLKDIHITVGNFISIEDIINIIRGKYVELMGKSPTYLVISSDRLKELCLQCDVGLHTDIVRYKGLTILEVCNKKDFIDVI